MLVGRPAHSQRNEKWFKLVMNWLTSDRRRKRGSPFRRWVDEIKTVASVTWTKVANDRDKWQQLEETFVN